MVLKLFILQLFNKRLSVSFVDEISCDLKVLTLNQSLRYKKIAGSELQPAANRGYLRKNII